MAEERKFTGKHVVTLDKRQNISITGVVDVISFDEETIIADTELGVLILKGMNLHVNKLNLESGELVVDGDIISLAYEEENNYGKNKTSIFSRIFK